MSDAPFTWHDVWELRSLSAAIREDVGAGLSLPVLTLGDAETVERVAAQIERLLPKPPDVKPSPFAVLREAVRNEVAKSGLFRDPPVVTP